MGKLTGRFATVLLAILLSAIGAAAQGYHFQGFALGSDGLPAGQVTITVCAAGAFGIPCSPTVTIYSNAAMTQTKSNPFTTTPLDHSDFDFYVPPGSYTYTITGRRLRAPGESFSITAPCVPDSSCAVPTLPLSVANGGTGTSSPGLVAGSGINISGTWPGQKISATVSGGAQLNMANTWTATQSFQPASGDALDFLNSSGSTVTGISTTGNGVIVNIPSGNYFNFQGNGSEVLYVNSSGIVFASPTVPLIWQSSGGYGGTFEATTLTANRTWTLPDAGGTVCIAGAGTSGCVAATNNVASEDLTSETGSIADTTMYTTPAAGFYRAEYASFSSDNTGATLVVNPIVAYYQHGIRLELQLAGFNETGIGTYGNSGVGVFYADAGTVIQYAASTTGFGGSGDYYDLHIRIEKVQ